MTLFVGMIAGEKNMLATEVGFLEVPLTTTVSRMLKLLKRTVKEFNQNISGPFFDFTGIFEPAI